MQTQLRIGMIGVSGAEPVAPLAPAAGRSVIAGGADINETLEQFRTEHGGQPFVTNDYRELLKRPDIDAIAVTSPDYCTKNTP